jgi:hypothetical protein
MRGRGFPGSPRALGYFLLTSGWGALRRGPSFLFPEENECLFITVVLNLTLEEERGASLRWSQKLQHRPPSLPKK